MHFGDVSETNDLLGPRDPKRIDRSELLDLGTRQCRDHFGCALPPLFIGSFQTFGAMFLLYLIKRKSTALCEQSVPIVCTSVFGN